MSQQKGNQHQRPIREQLKDALPSLLKSNLPRYVGSWKKDGVDHINIGPKAATQLGRRLSFDSPRALMHPLLGTFASLYNLGVFLLLSTPDDAIRHELPFRARATWGRLYTRNRHALNMKAIMLDSAWRLVCSSNEVKADLMKTDMPFDAYRVLDSGIRERLCDTDWVVAGYEEIRRALREGRDPDFRFFTDTPGEDIYKGILTALRPADYEDVPVEDKKPSNAGPQEARGQRAPLSEAEEAARKERRRLKQQKRREKRAKAIAEGRESAPEVMVASLVAGDHVTDLIDNSVQTKTLPLPMGHAGEPDSTAQSLAPEILDFPDQPDDITKGSTTLDVHVDSADPSGKTLLVRIPEDAPAAVVEAVFDYAGNAFPKSDVPDCDGGQTHALCQDDVVQQSAEAASEVPAEVASEDASASYDALHDAVGRPDPLPVAG